MRFALTLVAVLFTFSFINASSLRAEEAKVKTQVLAGSIKSVDLKAKTFVLVATDNSETTFKVYTESYGRRDATRFLLDGKKATLEAAVQAGRAAAVTYVKVSDADLWVWQVAVTSAATQPDKAPGAHE